MEELLVTPVFEPFISLGINFNPTIGKEKRQTIT